MFIKLIMHIFLNNINIIINKILYSFDIYIILIFIHNKHSRYNNIITYIYFVIHFYN